MTHESEFDFEDRVIEWFQNEYGEGRVHTQVYQPGPYWFVDIVVTLPYATLFIEVENDADSVRNGIAQAQGYAAADPVKGVPMVVTPRGHLEDAEELRRNTPAVVREFDGESGEWV